MSDPVTTFTLSLVAICFVALALFVLSTIIIIAVIVMVNRRR
jgi:hypothetical protein